MRVINKSSRSIMTERKLRQLVSAAAKKTSDKTKFDQYCEKFRICCSDIRSETTFKKFRGGYDEIEKLYATSSISDNVLAMLKHLEAIDKVCKYEGEKLGYRFSDWWKKCWELELANEAKEEIYTR